MAINQTKMLTTSCKNYESLKQCVIEKERRTQNERIVEKNIFKYVALRAVGSEKTFHFFVLMVLHL